MLNGSENQNSKFATKKWYVIDSESKSNYSHPNPINFLTKSTESILCGYSDAYILVTGNITVTRTIAVPDASPTGTRPQRKQPPDPATRVVFKIVHHLKNVLQKLMVLLLMKRVLLLLQCLSTT